MKHLFVKYEVAEILKELNFDEPCFGWYEKFSKELNIQGFHVIESPHHNQYLARDSKDIILAPMYLQVLDFLKSKYKIHIYLDEDGRPKIFKNHTILFELRVPSKLQHGHQFYRYAGFEYYEALDLIFLELLNKYKEYLAI